MLRRILHLAPFLAAFWLLLSGHYTALLLSLGVLSVLLVVWIIHRMEVVDGIEIRAWPTRRAPVYAGWLAGQVVKSGLVVLRKVWSPRATPTPRPVVGWTPVRELSEVGTVVYANSITLTPGTLSLQVGDEGIEVHALDESGLAELREGEMLRRVRRAGRT